MVYEFGPFGYGADQKLLFRQDELVPLAPKAVDTLEVLVNRRGRVVDKTELMKLVWPDTVVEEVGLARNVSLLRKALGDETETVAYIETIPKRGYRFIAEVRVIATGGGQPAPRTHRRGRHAAGTQSATGALVYWPVHNASPLVRPVQATP